MYEVTGKIFVRVFVMSPVQIPNVKNNYEVIMSDKISVYTNNVSYLVQGFSRTKFRVLASLARNRDCPILGILKRIKHNNKQLWKTTRQHT